MNRFLRYTEYPPFMNTFEVA